MPTFLLDKNFWIMAGIALVLGGATIGGWKLASMYFKPRIATEAHRADNNGMVADSATEENKASNDISRYQGDFRRSQNTSRTAQEKTHDQIEALPAARQSVPDDVAAVLRSSDVELRNTLRQRSEAGS